MKTRLFVLILSIALIGARTAAADPLPSWNDTGSKKAIVAFVENATTAGSPDYVIPAERVAVFDNDGTLWSEQPPTSRPSTSLDRIKALAPEHPEWKEKEPFASILKGDLKTRSCRRREGPPRTRHGHPCRHHVRRVPQHRPRLAEDRPSSANRKAYTAMVYQPMLELLAYLRANGFKTFIVSGGGIDFIRVFAEETYGIPPEQVVGSSIKAKYELRDGKPVIVKMPDLDFIDDGPGKPVGIHQHIGRRPIAAFGNSDGDFEMLEWTTSGDGARFGLLVHHDDAEREFAYDRESHIGKLARGLDAAPKHGWTVVSMKADWKSIYP